jgi:hypothetical protein
LNESFEQYINGKRENLYSNFTLRLKKILWEARSTPTFSAALISTLLFLVDRYSWYVKYHLLFEVPIGIWSTNWYLKYQLVFDTNWYLMYQLVFDVPIGIWSTKQLVFEIPIAFFFKALVFKIPFCRLVFEIPNKCL